MENVRKHRNSQHVTTKARRTDLVSDPNYHISFFFRKSVSHGNEKKHKYS